MWEILVFYWVGWATITLICSIILGYFFRELWETIFKSVPFYWRMGFIAWTKQYGFKEGTTKREFKDNDGNIYEIRLKNKGD